MIHPTLFPCAGGREGRGGGGEGCILLLERAGLGVSERVINSVFIIVRMNMPHDDDEKCKEFQQNNPTTFVMSRTLDHNSNPWEWSLCSRRHVTHFIE